MTATQSIRRTREFERGTVRDIRDDLIERLEAANAEMASARTQYDADRREVEQRFHQRFEDIGARQRALGLLIDAETPHHHSLPGRPMPARDMRLPLQDFIMNGLNAVGSMSKDEVKDMVERAGYGGNEGVGRMVHTTLLNLKNAGRLLLMADGQYEVATRDLSRGKSVLATLDELFGRNEKGPITEEEEIDPLS